MPKVREQEESSDYERVPNLKSTEIVRCSPCKSFVLATNISWFRSLDFFDDQPFFDESDAAWKSKPTAPKWKVAYDLIPFCSECEMKLLKDGLVKSKDIACDVY